MSSAAAPMIGVASRNAKRAASSFESPASRPPPIVAPEREKPGISASACAAPTPSASRHADACGDARVPPSASSSVGHDGRAAPQALGPVQQDAVQGQEERSRARATRRRCAAGPAAAARAARRGSCRRSAASRASRRCRRAISRRASERPSPRMMRTQSRQKKPSSTSAVARCVATRNVRKNGSFWWMSQPKMRGQDHAVAEARDREQLADALQQSEQDRLPVRDHACAPLDAGGPTTGDAARSMPGRPPAIGNRGRRGRRLHMSAREKIFFPET